MNLRLTTYSCEANPHIQGGNKSFGERQRLFGAGK